MQVDGLTPLWVAARVLLYKRGDDFFMRMEKALKTSDPEEIHDLRVASRRLREGLALFAPCYPAANIARLVKQIKQVTRLLGEIRNTDEAIIFFSAMSAELDDACRGDLEMVTATFRKNREKELKRFQAGLRDIASGKVRDQLRRVVNAPNLFVNQLNGVDLFMLLSRFAKDAFDERLADILKLLPVASQVGEAEAQHLLRIAVKHLRYRMEILSFLIGVHYGELHGALKGYQDLLGKMHDLTVFAGIIRNARLPFEIEKMVLDAIALKGERLFIDFSEMLVSTPFEKIGEEVRNAL
jgi:CHAD domain-containing protein